MSAAVYVQTNEPENRVLAFRRDADGALGVLGAYPTGGAGDGAPHLTSQGSVVLSDDGRHLLVTMRRATTSVSLRSSMTGSPCSTALRVEARRRRASPSTRGSSTC